MEANPWYYKLPPGYTREAFGPLYLELLVELSRLLDAQKLLTDEDRHRIETIRRKLEVLVNGGIVGKPRKGMGSPYDVSHSPATLAGF